MQKMKTIIIYFLKVLFSLFIISLMVGYSSKKQKQDRIIKLAKKYKQKIILNGWSNDTIALTIAAVEVNLEDNKKIDCSKNTQCYKNIKHCLGAIFINVKYKSDNQIYKLTNSKKFRECLTTGNSYIFFEYLKLKNRSF